MQFFEAKTGLETYKKQGLKNHAFCLLKTGQIVSRQAAKLTLENTFSL